MAKKRKTREVEYFRCWGGDHGTWDTDFIDVPADTPKERMNEAVKEAVEKLFAGSDNEPPAIVGLYCTGQEEDE